MRGAVPVRHSAVPHPGTTVRTSARHACHLDDPPGKPARTPRRGELWRGVLFWLALALSSPACAGSAQAQGSKAVKIDQIRAHLFYERSGRLSKNIAPPASFGGFNTMIGEGDAEEPAQDVLIVVELSGPKDELVQRPLTITVSHPGGKRPPSKREFKDGLLFGESGKVAKAMYAENATCSPMRVAASMGASTKQIAIDFKCGE